MAWTEHERIRVSQRFADRRIFVSIAAYRDGDLARTVHSAIRSAAEPSRLRFGICHQFDAPTERVLHAFDDDPRVHVNGIDHRESLGIGWARSRANELFDHEPYLFQIDAPARFAACWDERCIAMLESTDSERPILTNYPPGLAAGNLFTLGRFVLDVPCDPQISFWGEDITLALRAYTHGYDLYWPNENVVHHWYQHASPLRWNGDHDHERLEARSGERVRRLLAGGDRDLRPYGLGRIRTLDAYRAFSGIDLPGDRLLDCSS